MKVIFTIDPCWPLHVLHISAGDFAPLIRISEAPYPNGGFWQRCFQIVIAFLTPSLVMMDLSIRSLKCCWIPAMLARLATHFRRRFPASSSEVSAFGRNFSIPRSGDASGLVKCSWQNPDVLVTWSESICPSCQCASAKAALASA